jgi:hypothetical protein
MKSRLALLVLVVLCLRLLVLAQEPASNSTSASASTVSGVPRLIRFSGIVKGSEVKPSTTLGITFLLYKDEQGGAPLWMETQNIQPDASGHYTVQLGSTQPNGVPVDLFSSGEAHWLGVQVQGQAEQPRVLLLSVPYALKAADAETLGGKPLSAFQLATPQAKSTSSTSSGNGKEAQPATEQPNEIRCAGSTGCKAGFIPRFATNGGSATVSNSIISQSGSKVNVAGVIAAQTGNFSQMSNNPVMNVTNSGNGDGIDISAGQNAITISKANFGVFVTNTGFDAIVGKGAGGLGGNFLGARGGVYAESDTDADQATASYGWEMGSTRRTIGVNGFSASGSGYGVYGQASGASSQATGTGAGVWGDSSAVFGVLGTSDSVYGVAGYSRDSEGVLGVGNIAGVGGRSTGEGNALFGDNAPSGTPSDVNATLDLINGSANPQFVLYAESVGGSYYVRTDNLGDLAATGSISGSSKNFKIDHPLDPANKYLMHTDIESPDMKNLYDGVTMLDANGEAWIELPSYFEALNRDFRYQLTAIGAPGPNLYIAEEISSNRFRIAGGKPGAKVSWQVTGIRHDAWANAHRTPVEIEKTGAERGRYLHPHVFGLGPEQSVSYNGGATRLKLPEIGRKRPNEMHPVTPLGKP